MKSSWEYTKERSNYHFDNFKNDSQVDKVTYLGRFVADFSEEVTEIVKNAKPATWRTRGAVGKSRPEEELASEDYDLERFGYGADYNITHLNWELTPNLKKISELFGLQDCMERIHVQRPGELWNLHIDKLQKWLPEDPSKILRVFIQLTDWQPGQFWEFGNYHWRRWVAGDVVSFDWQNMPHATANAGYHPRVTMQITGVRS